MKKLAALTILLGCLCSFGCTETEEAIEEFCKWEKSCNIRTYDACITTYKGYLEKAPGCEDELNS